MSKSRIFLQQWTVRMDFVQFFFTFRTVGVCPTCFVFLDNFHLQKGWHVCVYTFFPSFAHGRHF